MKTINPAAGQGAWAVTKVLERKLSNGALHSSKVEILKDGMATERQARDLRFKNKVNRGVFEFG
jgi:hypothetical protein